MMAAALHTAGLTLLPIRSEILNDVWPYAEPWVARAIERSAAVETVEGYRAECAARTAQLWMMVENNQAVGCGITKIFETSRGLTCEVSVASAAGSRHQMLRTHSSLSSSARSRSVRLARR